MTEVAEELRLLFFPDYHQASAFPIDPGYITSQKHGDLRRTDVGARRGRPDARDIQQLTENLERSHNGRRYL